MRPRIVFRGRGAVLLAAVGAAALMLLAPAALASAPTTPSVTIVGAEYYTPTPSASPTAAAEAVNDPWVELYFQDNDWGATSFRLSNDGGVTWGDATDFVTYLSEWYLFASVDDPMLTIDGSHTVTAQFSSDGGSTWGGTANATTIVDTQMPVVTAPEGYWNPSYPYVVSAHDQVGLSGVQALWYRVDAGQVSEVTNTQPVGTSTPLSAAVELTGDTGTPHTISSIALDYAGNSSVQARYALKARLLLADRGFASIQSYSAYVVLDRTPPTVKARGVSKNWRHRPVVVRFAATDRLAGVASIEYSVTSMKAKKAGWWTAGTRAVVTSNGRHKVWYRAIDAAQPVGNTSKAHYVVVKIRR